MDFFSDNRLDSSKINARARKLYNEPAYSQSHSFAFAPGTYELTRKQIAFIQYALDDFKDLYLPLYQFYSDNTETSVLRTLWEKVEARFNLQRNDFILGQTPAETGGFFRGAIAAFFLAKTEVKAQQQRNIQVNVEQIAHAISFFGDCARANNLFIEFILRIAIRFQNAIELIANHQDGLSNLAQYMATMCLHSIVDRPVVQFEGAHTTSEKVALLVKYTLTRRDAMGEDTETTKPGKTVWKKTKLLTEDGKMNWSIVGLLHKSTIESSSKLYFYSGKGKKGLLFYPAQICTTIELEQAVFYQTGISFG